MLSCCRKAHSSKRWKTCFIGVPFFAISITPVSTRSLEALQAPASYLPFTDLDSPGQVSCACRRLSFGDIPTDITLQGGHIDIENVIQGEITIVCAKIVTLLPAPLSVDNINTFARTIVGTHGIQFGLYQPLNSPLPLLHHLHILLIL